MKIYDTLSKQLKELPPPEEQKKLKMFVCGPTVYDYIHIGNARTFVFFDVVAKYLKYKGYDVDYIQNITDIDDKIINKANQENKSWKEIADYYFEAFKKDVSDLGITSPRYIKASDYIEEVKKQVKTLKSKGNVYLVENDGWYFDLKTFPEYGKLSGRTAEMADDAVSRIDESSKKRNKGDFCVWKLSKPEEPSWPDEELGAGRPGWHIEDTAITEKEFGPQYGIHGGGQDLIFPHHEAEIAQQSSAAGIKPEDFVKIWMHAGFLVNKEEKMSKSAGNFMTLQDAFKFYPKETLRFHFLSAHYRNSLDFGGNELVASVMASAGIREFRNRLALIRNEDQKENTDEIVKIVEEAKEKIIKSLDDDFNTPEALAAYFDFMKDINKLFDQKKLGKSMGKILSIVSMVDKILGIIPADTNYIDNLPKEIRILVDERELARQNKDWERADEIRDKLKNMGYPIDDTPYGPTGPAM